MQLSQTRGSEQFAEYIYTGNSDGWLEMTMLQMRFFAVFILLTGAVVVSNAAAEMDDDEFFEAELKLSKVGSTSFDR